MQNAQKITITRPDDWHCHFRDDDLLTRTVPDAAKQFARAIAMPNLKDPVDSFEKVQSYHQRIVDAIPAGANFEPMMTMYLSAALTPEAVAKAHAAGLLKAIKYYPSGVTTNSRSGVANVAQMAPVLDKMAELDIPLLMHGETSDNAIDIFDREKHFIDHEWVWLREHYPNLRLVLEHITTAYAANAVREANANNIAATITAHHLFIDRNDLLSGGIKPDLYCLPIAKSSSDREALVAAATSGLPCFFLGTDSAPHASKNKYSPCGCAGIYTALHAMPLYATAFEQVSALDKLEDFASHFGADFYGVKRSDEKLTLVKKDFEVPPTLSFGDEAVVPFMAGKVLPWQVCDV
jgi:dihydroorotase